MVGGDINQDKYIPARLRPWAAQMYIFTIAAFFFVLALGASIGLEVFSVTQVDFNSPIFYVILCDILLPFLVLYDNCIGFTALSSTKITLVVATLKRDIFKCPDDVLQFIYGALLSSLVYLIAVSICILMIVFYKDKIIPHLPIGNETDYEQQQKLQGKSPIRYHSITDCSEI